MAVEASSRVRAPGSRWKRRLLVHVVPLAAAVAATALVTSALEPVPLAVVSHAKDLNAAWIPSVYRGSLDDALGAFLRPIERMLGVPDSPSTPWSQPGVNGGHQTAIQATSFERGGSRVEPALRTGAGSNGGGLIPWETFDHVPLTTDTTAVVDQGDGNLMLQSTDGTLNTVGVPLSNTRYFNSLATYAGSFGGKWLSNLSGFDVGLLTGTTNRYYIAPSGNTESFSPDGSGGWKQPPSFNATLTTSSTGATLVMNDSGETITFNASGWVTSDVNQNGVGNSYTYDSAGEVTKVTEASGRFFSLTWSNTTPSYIASITDSANRTTTYTHDSSGRLTRVDSPGGYWETYAYNAAGLVSEVQAVGPNSSTNVLVDLTYDSSNRLLSISQGTAGSSTYARTTTYSGWGASGTVSVTDGDGHVTQRGISASNVPISSTDPLGRKASWTHNANGDVNSYTAPGATSSTTITYNSNNSPTSTTTPTGASTTTTYGATSGCSGSGGTAYDPHCTTDPSGNTTALQYDSNGNLTASTDATSGGTSASTTYTYATASSGCYTTTSGGTTVVHGLAGQVCSSTTPNGNVTTYEYDAAGNQTAVDPPAPLGRTTKAYDPLGRVTSSTDGNGKTTTYSYNVRDQVISTAYDGGAVETATYAPNALEAGTSIDSNNKDSYTYDVLGELLTEGQRHNGVTNNLSYTYDSAGNLLTYTDLYGTVTYGYDAANELTSLTEPGGTCGSGTPAASSGCIKFGYDLLGNETSRTFPGGAVVTTVRDGSGRPTRITAKDATGTTVYDKAYDYSLAGADTADVQKTTSYVETGVPAGATTAYSYDSLDRLTSSVETAHGTTNASWAYSYDGDGNRTQEVLTGDLGTAPYAEHSGTIHQSYNAADEMTSTTSDASSWTYDADGAMTHDGFSSTPTTYNDRGGVTSSGSASSYVSYGAGNSPMYARSDGGTTTNYTNSSKLGLMGEDYGNQRIYDRTPEGTAIGSRLGGGSKYYFIQDGIGSVVGIFDKDGGYYGGYTYGPYGAARFTGGNAALSNNHLRYIGGYWDASVGDYLLGARYYDPLTGRFTQVDPSGQEVNNYAYSADNPIGNIDTTGQKTKRVNHWWGWKITLSNRIVQDLLAAIGLGTAGLASLTWGLAMAGVEGAAGVAGALLAIGGEVAAVIQWCSRHGNGMVVGYSWVLSVVQAFAPSFLDSHGYFCYAR